jgi:hypothetical protein
MMPGWAAYEGDKWCTVADVPLQGETGFLQIGRIRLGDAMTNTGVHTGSHGPGAGASMSMLGQTGGLGGTRRKQRLTGLFQCSGLTLAAPDGQASSYAMARLASGGETTLAARATLLALARRGLECPAANQSRGAWSLLRSHASLCIALRRFSSGAGFDIRLAVTQAPAGARRSQCSSFLPPKHTKAHQNSCMRPRPQFHCSPPSSPRVLGGPDDRPATAPASAVSTIQQRRLGKPADASGAQ